MSNNAFNNVQPISSEITTDLYSIIRNILSVSGQGVKSWTVLGSAFKKELIGDLDIGINNEQTINGCLVDFTFDELIDLISSKFNADDFIINRSLEQIYSRIQMGDNWHQVDWMLGPLAWLKFSYYSPDHNSSKYFGSHRTILLQTLANLKTSWVKYENDELVAKTGYVMLLNKGLVHCTRWRPIGSKGNRLSKFENVTENNMELFKKYHPDCPNIENKTISQPTHALEILFGKQMEESDVSTFEKIWNIINQNPSIDKIIQLYKDRLISNNLNIPKQIQ